MNDTTHIKQHLQRIARLVAEEPPDVATLDAIGRLAHETLRELKTFSVRNAYAAEAARPCDCHAYVDIFNLTRWRRAGFATLPQAAPTTCRVLKFPRRKGKRRRVCVTAILLCRCQVFDAHTHVTNLYFNSGANR